MVSKAMVTEAHQAKAELMARGGIDLTVVVPERWPEGATTRTAERRAQDAFRLAVLPITFPGHFHVHFYRGLAKLVANVAPAVVHADEEPYNLATVQTLAAARRAGARTVFFTWQNLDRALPPPFGWLERWTYRHADGAIAGGTDARDVLRRRGFGKQTWVLPQFGVDETRFTPGPTRRLEAVPADGCGRPFVVGFVGRLVPEKGVDLLIRAAAREPQWSIVIAGAGPERARLENEARAAGVGDRARFLGPVPAAALPDVYRSLDALVLPSRATSRWTEQFGRVLIEAMASGVPCVGAATGEIPEVLGDSGLTFAEGQADDLHRALSRLALDPELRIRLAAAGRARVLERYTMDRIARETVKIYAAVTGGGHADLSGNV